MSVRNSDRYLLNTEKAKALEIAQAAWLVISGFTVISPGQVDASQVREEVFKHQAPVRILERASAMIGNRLSLLRAHSQNIKNNYQVADNVAAVNRLTTAPIDAQTDW